MMPIPDTLYHYLGVINSYYPNLAANLNDLLLQSRIAFSQNGEDLVVRNFLNGAPAPIGMYVDIGAYHPIRFSNTFALYLAGWRGVNIDANIEAINEFNRLRPDEINLHLAVAPSPTKLQFARFEEGAYNTLNYTRENLAISNISSPLKDIQEMECAGINDVLDKYTSGKKFDFLNIDVEGLDLRLFNAIDFTRFRPHIVAVEFDHPYWVTYEFITKLARIGYEFCSQCGGTSIFTRIDKAV